jgi:hypothetical protein
MIDTPGSQDSSAVNTLGSRLSIQNNSHEYSTKFEIVFRLVACVIPNTKKKFQGAATSVRDLIIIFRGLKLYNGHCTGWGSESWTIFCGPATVAIGGCEQKD